MDEILYLAGCIFIFFFNDCNILFCCSTSSCCCCCFFDTRRSSSSRSRLIWIKKNDRFYIEELFCLTRIFATCIRWISSCTTNCSGGRSNIKCRWTATTTSFISIWFWISFISRWWTTIVWSMDNQKNKVSIILFLIFTRISSFVFILNKWKRSIRKGEIRKNLP